MRAPKIRCIPSKPSLQIEERDRDILREIMVKHPKFAVLSGWWYSEAVKVEQNRFILSRSRYTFSIIDISMSHQLTLARRRADMQALFSFSALGSMADLTLAFGESQIESVNPGRRNRLDPTLGCHREYCSTSRVVMASAASLPRGY